MTGMPEIVGESQDEALEPADDLVEGNETRPLFNFPKARGTPQSVVHISPLRLRLDDFSGQGERAPPGWMTSRR